VGEVRNLNVERAVRAEDNTLLSPADCLEDALNEVRSGKRDCDAVLVLTLDKRDGCFNTGFYACNIKASEMLALMEVHKTKVLRDMGFLPG
jgi:hypothetical protein